MSTSAAYTITTCNEHASQYVLVPKLLSQVTRKRMTSLNQSGFLYIVPDRYNNQSIEFMLRLQYVVIALAGLLTYIEATV